MPSAAGVVQTGVADLIKQGCIDGVLMDIDGTLTNSDPIHETVFREMLMESGFNNHQPITHEYFKEQISGGNNAILTAKLWPNWTQSAREAWIDEKEARFRALAATSLKPLPGLLDFLQWLQQRGVRVGAVTNAPKANAQIMLAGIGLQSHFEVVIFGEECTRPKPFPDPYQAGMVALGLTPERTLVFEDSAAGAMAGVASGAITVAVLTSQSAERMQAVGVKECIQDYTDMLDMNTRAELAAQ
ncbi:hypothetical protein WJX72_012220 [[Myrmecia] bisecta]|uniref:Uncharacterized protein n=1 Tax=[Myrmecia] bisecta TaxID=41462 RepID=A0AAW1PIK1_9CHLO